MTGRLDRDLLLALAAEVAMERLEQNGE